MTAESFVQKSLIDVEEEVSYEDEVEEVRALGGGVL